MSVRSIAIRVDGAIPVWQIPKFFFQNIGFLIGRGTSCFTALTRSEIANAFTNLCSHWTPCAPLIKLHVVQTFFDVQSEVIEMDFTLSFEHCFVRFFGIRSPFSSEIGIVQVALKASTFETTRLIVLSCSDAQDDTDTSLRVVVHSPDFLVDFCARIVCAEAAIDVLEPVDYRRFEIGRGRRCGTSYLPYWYVVSHVRVSVEQSLFGVRALV